MTSESGFIIGVDGDSEVHADLLANLGWVRLSTFGTGSAMISSESRNRVHMGSSFFYYRGGSYWQVWTVGEVLGFAMVHRIL